MTKGIQIRNWQHFKLIKDLQQKRDGHMRKLRSQDEDFDNRPNTILFANVDRISEGWSDEDRDALMTALKAEVSLDPLSSNKGLTSTDNLRAKLYPYLNRNGIRNSGKGYVDYLKRPDIPIPLVKNVLRIDLGMANTIENNIALKEVGWPHPPRDDATRFMRIGVGGLTYHTVCGRATKLEPKFGPDGQRVRNRKVLEFELITIPNVILDNLVGNRRDDGRRDSSKIPVCWRKWRSSEVDDSVRKGSSREVELPDGVEPVAAEKPKSTRKPRSGRQAVKNHRRTKTKDDGSSSKPVESLDDIHGYLTVKELRQMCKDASLVQGGNKADLLERLAEAGVLERVRS